VAQSNRQEVHDVSVTLGVDIGQASDPSALILLESYRPTPTDSNEWLPVRHRIGWIERVPLGTLYGQVVERIATVAESARAWGSPIIVLDATGVGRPIVDMLKARTTVQLRAVTFTAGEHEVQPQFDVFRVPKVDLVTSLETVLQSRRLECAPDVPLQEDLTGELSIFDFTIGERGRATFEAASGSHDDLVCALMLAVWWAERPNPAAIFHQVTQMRLAERQRQ
jgi:hypothetical protein